MQALLEPLVRKLFPLVAGLAAGAWLVGLPVSFGAVASGDCQTFRGVSQGNDPTQEVVFNLCRRGDRLEGVKRSEGEAGQSAYVLEGTLVDDQRLEMTITHVLQDEPAPGWISCSDDVFHLRWDAASQSLVGDYVSVECEDHATLQLEWVPPQTRAYRSCGS